MAAKRREAHLHEFDALFDSSFICPFQESAVFKALLSLSALVERIPQYPRIDSGIWQASLIKAALTPLVVERAPYFELRRRGDGSAGTLRI